jgi:hypothetical protein
MTRRRVCMALIALTAAVVTVLLARSGALASTDIYGNVGPSAGLPGGSLAERYPLSHYWLDQHFDAVSTSLDGIDASGVPPMIAGFLADTIWQLTTLIASGVIALFGFAFSLDLINGSPSTGGAGALAPVAAAISNVYHEVFGGPWMAAAVALAGCWAMWKALVQRRYSETAGSLGLSLIYIVVALALVTQPQRTIGEASHLTNQASAAFLSLSIHGDVRDPAEARTEATDQLFELLIYDPWTVLEFGGLAHCVRPGTGDADHDPDSVGVQPLSARAARALKTEPQVDADGKTCISNRAKYAPHFLAYGPNSNQRGAEYDALNHGDSGRLPDEDAGKRSRLYQLSVADKPASDSMEKGGQYQRLGLALVIFGGELGAFLLVGGLSVGVIVAQVLFLLLLAFAPVALVAAVVPGHGHRFFRGWLGRLASFLARKAAYSLVLAVVLAVAAAVADATDQLGWLMSFGLQALFFWTAWLMRHRLTTDVLGAAVGSENADDRGLRRLQTAFYATALARTVTGAVRAHRRRRHDPRPAPAEPSTLPEQSPSDATQRADSLAPSTAAGPAMSPAAAPPQSADRQSADDPGPPMATPDPRTHPEPPRGVPDPDGRPPAEAQPPEPTEPTPPSARHATSDSPGDPAGRRRARRTKDTSPPRPQSQPPAAPPASPAAHPPRPPAGGARDEGSDRSPLGDELRRDCDRLDTSPEASSDHHDDGEARR